MTTPTVWNVIEDPSGDPIPGVAVAIRLITETAGDAPGWLSDLSIRGTWRTRTRADGKWSIELSAATDEITPAGSVYEVMEYTGPTARPYYIDPVAADGEGPLWAGDLLATAPEALQQSAIETHETEWHGRARWLSTFDGADPTGATDCHAVVTAAIASTAALGQVLIVDGTYLCSDMVTLVDDAHLFGFGEGMSVLQFDWSTQTPNNSYLYGTGLNNVQFNGVEVLGAGDGTPWGSTAQSGAVVAGLRLVDCTNVRLDAPTFRHVPGLNIILNAVRKAQLVAVNVFGSGRDGVHITNQGTLVAEDISVQSCMFYECGDDAIAINAGTAANGTAATVSTTAGSTTVTGSGTAWVAGDVGDLIAIEGADGGGLLEAVIATWVSATEITIDRKAPTSVSLVDGHYGYVRSTGMRVIGNTIFGQAAAGDPLAAGRGIYCAGSDGPVFIGNTIRSTHGTGFEFDDDENVPLVYTRNPIVFGNTIIDAGQAYGGVNAAGRHGMRVYACIGGGITGNTIRDAYACGIAAARYSDTIIMGNDVEGCGSESGDVGILLDGVSGDRKALRGRCTNNNVRRSWGAGIRVNYAPQTAVEDNTCTDNGRSGLLGEEDCGIVVRGDGVQHIHRNHCTDTRPPGSKTQRLGVLIGNDGGSPTIHITDNYCIGNHVSPGISLNNPTGTYYADRNRSSSTDPTADRRRIGDWQEINGTGSPEGVVTAPVGSVFHRTDGGAATSLYVKESGTGTTGWVAK